MTVIRLEPPGLRAASEAIARAFQDDPLQRYVFPALGLPRDRWCLPPDVRGRPRTRAVLSARNDTGNPHGGGDWREGYSIFSYRPSDSTYLYHGFRTGGTVETMTGTATIDGWSFEAANGVGAGRQRLRVTIERLASGGFHLIDASAIGDGPFVTGDTVRYVRLSASP